MQRITATAAAMVLAATPALAQETVAADESMAAETDWAQLIRTRDITGGPVYTTNEAYDEGSWGGDGDYAWGWSGREAVGAACAVFCCEACKRIRQTSTCGVLGGAARGRASMGQESNCPPPTRWTPRPRACG